MLLFMNHCNQN